MVAAKSKILKIMGDGEGELLYLYLGFVSLTLVNDCSPLRPWSIIVIRKITENYHQQKYTKNSLPCLRCWQ